MRGALVCRMHGGQAPQTKAAAEQRMIRARAERDAARLLAKVGVDADPLEHLLEELYRSAAVAQVLGGLVAALDEVERGIDRGQEPTRGEGLLARRPFGTGGEHVAVVHPYVRLWTEERDRHARLAKLCLDAGVAERQVRLAEQQADLLVRVIEAALDDPGLGLDAAGRRNARQVFARHLRAAELPA